MVMGNDTIIPKITLHKTIKIDLLAILLAKQSTDNMIFFFVQCEATPKMRNHKHRKKLIYFSKLKIGKLGCVFELRIGKIGCVFELTLCLTHLGVDYIPLQIQMVLFLVAEQPEKSWT